MQQADLSSASFDEAPAPDLVSSLDDVTAALRELRAWAGSPSYTQIAQRLRDRRRARGVPAAESTPGRVTVYECFRDGRRRIDVDLVVDIAAVLGCPDHQLPLWRHAVRAAGSPGVADRVMPLVSALPADRPDLYGRHEVLRKLVDASGARVHLIHGLPGVGKTTLAVAAAHDLLKHGRIDRVVRVDLRGLSRNGASVDPFEVMTAVLRRHLGGSVPNGPRALQSCYLRLLGAHRTLLLLDDVPAWSQIEPLLPPDASTRTIATSRWAEPLPRGVVEIRLDGLGEQAAAELLTATTGHDLSRDDPAVRELCRMTGRLPLALSLVGQRIATRPEWSLSDHAAAYRDRLSILQLEDGIDGTLAVMYGELPAADRSALRRLSLHPTSGFGMGAARALTGLPEDECRAALRGLERAHLLHAQDEGRWEMHNLVQVFGARMAFHDDRPADRDEAVGRLVDHYTRAAADAVSGIHPSAPNDWYWMDDPRARPLERSEAVAWLQQELSTVLDLATWMIDHGRADGAARLVAVLSTHLWASGAMEQTLALHQSARASVAGSDLRGQALAERNLGMTHLRMSRYAGARVHLERARELYREAGQVGGEMSSTTNLAVVEMITGDHEKALELLERTSRHYREAGRIDHLTSALSNKAIALTRTGRARAAIECLDEVVTLAIAHDLPSRERLARTNLVDLLVESEDPADLAKAVRMGRRAIEVATQMGDERGIAYSRAGLAAALHRVGDGDQARHMALEALEQARALTAPDLASSILNSLGEMDLRDGDEKAARHRFEAALAQADEIGEAFEADRARAGLGALSA